jgi:hypothetical protein
MNFALELFLTTLVMIYTIVIFAEIIWKVQARFGGEK